MGNYKKLGKVLRLYLPFINQQKVLFIVSTLLAIGVEVVSVIAPIYFQKTIDALVQSSNDTAIIIFAIFALLIILYRVSNFLLDRLKIRLQATVMNISARDVFTHFQLKSKSFFENNFSGALVNKFDKFLTAFEYLHDIYISNILVAIVQILGVLFVMFNVNFYLGFVFLFWIIVQYLFGIYLIKKKIPLSIDKARKQSGFIAVISDFITNATTAIAFSNKSLEFDNLNDKNNNLYFSRLKDWNYSSLVTFLVSTTASLFGMVLIGVGIYQFIQGNITIGILVLINSYLGNIRHSIRSLTMALDKGSAQLSNAYEMYEILQTPIEITDAEDATELDIASGKITFVKTTFNYTGEGNDEIDNLNMTIAAGESIGLVGHSGAGKSTIVKFLLRFIDVTNGSIKIDDQDIRGVTQESLRKSIAYVPQEPLLFHRSLYENISYGKPGASLDEVIEAAKKAKAHKFIQDLPNGYDTLVGERGVKLSGGQRQRVAIARAIIKDAPILILDEATSSLDSKSESEIQEAISNLIEGRTVIAIAHRLSTIKHLDRIIVLEEGKIAEEGSHKQLLEKGGIYSELWNHQVGGFISE